MFIIKAIVKKQLQELAMEQLKGLAIFYGILRAGALAFGIGSSIKEFIGRLDKLEAKMAVLDRLIEEEERRLAEEQRAADAVALLSQIEDAHRIVADFDAQKKEFRAEREALKELVRQRKNNGQVHHHA